MPADPGEKIEACNKTGGAVRLGNKIYLRNLPCSKKEGKVSERKKNNNEAALF